MSELPAFAFSTIGRLLCEPGAAARLGQYVREVFPSVSRALIVTDSGIAAAGMLDAPRLNLSSVGIASEIFSAVVADPPEAVVLEGVEMARQKQVDLVIGLGGGSSMDVAKLIAVLANSEQHLADIYGIANVRGSRLPLVQVPTTAGTGSEASNIAIVTTGETSKMGVVAPQLYADLAVLDAQLTIGLPAHVTAATGIDAMVHAIEAYTSRHKKNPISDLLALAALSLLSKHLVRACKDGGDLAARQAMLLGATLAGQAFSNAPVGAVHALAYPIGGIFHVPHGLSNALVLPHVMRFNLPSATAHYAQLAHTICPGQTGSDEAKAEALIAAMQQFSHATGIQTTLRQVGIARHELTRLADDAMLQTRLLGNNPREVAYADALAIYTAAY